MKIEHIRVHGFGRLTDFDTGPKTLGRLVVVLGPNEAGKSTLFSFLTTALYGFSPASRELSPYVPWGADEAGGEVVIRLRDGSCASVFRRLRSSPSGTLSVGEATQELRNRPVRWVEHVPRTVFRQVFAITLAELAGLDEDTWGSIQDRVLGSMGASDLRSARAVADELEKEAGEIWRPNRRGNQRLRDLQSRTRALRSRRSEAVERDREIRGLVEERENVHLQLQDARADRHRDKLAVDRVQELIPVKRQLQRIEELKEEAGDEIELQGLPGDLVEHRRRLAERCRRLAGDVDELDAELAGPRAALERYDEASRKLLEHEVAISSFLSRAEHAKADQERVGVLEADLREWTAGLSSALRQLTTSDAATGEAEPAGGEEGHGIQADHLPDLAAVSAVSVDLLRDRVQRLTRVREEEVRERAAADGRSEAAGRHGFPRGQPWSAPGRPGSMTPVLTLVGLGAGLLIWGLLGGPMLATAGGAACLAVGVTLALTRRPRPTPAAVPPSRSRSEELREEVAAMLTGVPVRREFLEPPGDALVSQLERVQELIRARRQARGEVELCRKRLAGLQSAMQELVRELGDELSASLDGVTANDPFQTAAAVGGALEDAETRRGDAQAARREADRLGRSREATASELREAEEELAALDARIADVTGHPAERGVHILQSRLEAMARARRLEEELEHAYPDLADRMARIRSAEEEGATWTVDEEDLARRKRRIEELDETIEALAARGEALERDALHLREQETVDAVDSAVESLREEEDQLKRERDRKWLLAKLVREADRRFREEHQPDLLRRASEYLERLTGGRYDRLMVDEESDGDLFQLMGPQLPTPVPLARPISTGTLEQAYLGLRLAIVDHLDQSEERLPLFMDEAFVNWDDRRREKGLEVLSEVSRSRQVFAFTCHPEMAEDLARRGACVLRLGR